MRFTFSSVLTSAILGAVGGGLFLMSSRTSATFLQRIVIVKTTKSFTVKKNMDFTYLYLLDFHQQQF